ncbi:MAG TPA: hypothetical protein VIM71_04095 [Lacunisphaera sp.]
MIIAAVIVVLLLGSLFWNYRPRRGHEVGFKFVYVNQDGSVREVSPGEQAYLSEKFSGGDSGRPYIKSAYESMDGWGSQSGFIERRRVPASVQIVSIHADYDEREKALGFDWLDSSRAVGDMLQKNPDGSINCIPNPSISKEERFELSRKYALEEQRREALARCTPNAQEADSAGTDNV